MVTLDLRTLPLLSLLPGVEVQAPSETGAADLDERAAILEFEAVLPPSPPPAYALGAGQLTAGPRTRQILIKELEHQKTPRSQKQMTTVRQLLDQKGHAVLSIGPDDTVLAAIKKMADNNVGSLVVLEDEELVGIISERHYARNVFLKGRSSPKTTVREVMSERVVCARLDQSVEECMAVMTEKATRHLPVLDHKQVVGIISIGDLVKSIISDQKFVIEQLEHYITS